VSLYGAMAAVAFGICVAVMGLAYRGILAPGLRQPEMDARRRALTRWIGTVVGFQLLLGAAIVVYLIVTAWSHTPTLGRALPPLGAVLGNALTLQLAVVRLARALRS
jgi:drug/metabolite transporter (DMT)-like permease